MIIYFSATGNCEFVAKKIAVSTGDRAVSVTHISGDVILRDGENLGIITPTYFWGLPSIMEDFLRDINIKNAENSYIYCIASYGTTAGKVDYFINQHLKKRKLSLSASYGIKTVDNWTVWFSVKDRDKINRLLSQEAVQIERTAEKIKAKSREFINKDKKSLFMSKMAGIFYGSARKTSHLNVSDSCIGCGLCEKGCPVGAIKTAGGRPVWIKEKCVMCLRCLHRCPEFAIQYDGKTMKNGQYVHPQEINPVNTHAVKNIKLFLFDMDGTLYLGEKLYPFTKELLKTIKAQGKKYLFMTNNSSKSVEDYIKELKGLGIDAECGDFITSSQATALYLKENCPDVSLYVCGTQSLKKELSQNGFRITQDGDTADCIVMGNDTELTFKKLDDICRMLSTRDIKYIATNPDYVCPTEYGSVPDCGSVCDMVFNATGKRPLFIGKPQPEMPLLAMKMTGCSPEETAVVGDRIYTDIKSGINAGTVTVLVLSGETTPEILQNSSSKPDFVFSSGAEILEIIKE